MQITKNGIFRRIVFRDQHVPEPRPRVHLGPWVGEFGYEVGSWLPFVRYMHPRLSGKRLVLSGDVGHHVLYEELADEYWALPATDGARLCEWRDGSADLGKAKAPGPVLRDLIARIRPDEQIWPRFFGEHEKIHRRIHAGQGSRAMADTFLAELGCPARFVLLFPRFRTGHRFESRNWPGWPELANTLDAFAISSGRIEDTLAPPVIPTTMVLDPLHELGVTIALLQRAAAVVSVSSGGALLAGCMHLHGKLFIIGDTDCANVLGRKPFRYVHPSTPARAVARMIDEFVMTSSPQPA